MGSVALAIVMIVICWSGLLQGAEEQGPVTCLNSAAYDTPFNDATELVQLLRTHPPAMLCSGASYPCTGYYNPSWNAMALLCVPTNTCISYNVLGNYLNVVLAQCNYPNNEVGGFYQLNEEQKFYLTSRTCPICSSGSVEALL